MTHFFATLHAMIKALAHVLMILAIAYAVLFMRASIANARSAYFFGQLPPVTLHLPKAKKLITRKDPAVDLKKLAKSIAIHETYDCGISYGAAKYHNCFGFRANGKFYRFSSKEQSYAYFYDLWERAYKGKPTLAHATRWVCGYWKPIGKACPGGNPTNWLVSVNRIYATL